MFHTLNPGVSKVIEYAPPYFALPPAGYGGSERVIANLVDVFHREARRLPFTTEIWASGDSYDAVPPHARPRLVPTAPAALGLQKPFESNAQIQKDLHALRRAMTRDPLAVTHFHTEDVHIPVFGHDPLLAARTLTTVHNPVKDWYHDYTAMPLVAISEAQRKLLGVEDFNFVRVVHNGIDENMFTPHYDVPADAPLTFLGRFSPDKNPRGAVDIAMGAGLPLSLAGTIDAQYPDTHAEIERLSREAGDGRIVLPGLVNDLHDPALGESSKNRFLGQSRAMLFPIQWQEPFGLVVIEANACGTPVIAFNHPGSAVDELIVDGVNGFKVNNVAEAVEAVGRLDRIDRRGVRSHFEKHFTAAIMAQRYADIITRDLPAYRRSLMPRAARLAPA
jgi:glycosyltransferase involved in cell wall biosynthesis